ncbi:hypothetical protein ACOSP7_004909 [Xanthoceras sorbifolium]
MKLCKIFLALLCLIGVALIRPLETMLTMQLWAQVAVANVTLRQRRSNMCSELSEFDRERAFAILFILMDIIAKTKGSVHSLARLL